MNLYEHNILKLIMIREFCLKLILKLQEIKNITFLCFFIAIITDRNKNN
jgi:hypothetical protein